MTRFSWTHAHTAISQLDFFSVCDLNASPELPFADASFDAVVCALSVQYLMVRARMHLLSLARLLACYRARP